MSQPHDEIMVSTLRVLGTKIDALQEDVSQIKQQQANFFGDHGENIDRRVREVANAAVLKHNLECPAKSQLTDIRDQLEHIATQRASERGWISGAWRVVVLVCVVVSFLANVAFAIASLRP